MLLFLLCEPNFSGQKFDLKDNGKGKESSRHVEETIKLLKKCSSLSSLNCCHICAWLKRSSYISSAVFSLQCELVNLLIVDKFCLQYNLWSITKKKTSYSFLKMVTSACIERIDDVDVIITFCSVGDVEYWLKQKSAAKVLSMNSAIANMHFYNQQYRLIERLHTLQKHRVQALILKMPVVNRVQNPSKWERMILKPSKRFGEYFDQNTYVEGTKGKHTPRICSQGKIDWMNASRFKDYRVLTDIRSEHVNIVAHVRIACDVPINAVMFVHLIGDSTVAGVCVADEDTVASYLQYRINKNKKSEEALYSCLIYGVTGGDEYYYQRRVRDVNASEGDVVVVVMHGVIIDSKGILRNYEVSNNMGWHNHLHTLEFATSCDENGVPLYDSQLHFDHPHNMGEVFLDLRHLNLNGNKKTAEILYDRLFVSPEKMSMTSNFIHYFCGLHISEKINEKFSKQVELSDNSNFLSFMRKIRAYRNTSQLTGVIVMNCNPFTLGHLYLAEIAATQVDKLFIFVVEENKSEFTFVERYELVMTGTRHLLNANVLPSSRFIISSITLPEYFEKSENQDVIVDASIDIEIFCKWIVQELGLGIRFVGSEPFDKVTLQYNEAMRKILPLCMVELRVITRKEFDGVAISASRVRTALKNGDFVCIGSIVPEGSLLHLRRR